MPSERLGNLKKRVRAVYDKINKVNCPVLGDYVYFNAKGFYHLRYETSGKSRTVKEIRYKLYLVEHVEEIVRNADVIDEVRLAKAPIGRKKKNGKKVYKDIIYSSIVGFVTASPKTKIKVVLRKVGTGKTIFWSVMKLKK